MKEKHKWKLWEIPIVILWFVGLFTFFHGIGYSKQTGNFDFKAGYFVIGILIIVPVYFYIRSLVDSEKGFPVESFNRDIVVQDIKRHKICKNVDLSRTIIESYVFGVGKDQNEYANIFYNKSDIKFVKSKLTIENYDKSLPTITAFTNIDKLILKEIFQKHPFTNVYFDKYIPKHYFIDLEFLEDIDLNNESENQINLQKI